MTATLLRRLEALEAAQCAFPAVRIVLLEMHKPSPVRPAMLRVLLDGGQMQQNDDETEEDFRARVRIAARQEQGQAVVLLDERDAEL